MPTPRIVSLVPSATETVFSLGLGDALVGRSHVCDWPKAAQQRPVLTEPRLSETSSRGIHDALRAHLAEGLAIYEIDLDALRALEPTHLLVQDQCSVCAVSPADLEAALAEWLGQKPILVRLAPHTLADVWADIQQIADALDCGDRGRALCLTLTDRITGLVERIGDRGGRGRRGDPSTRPKVACVEWLDPIMIAGHWVPELVRLAGGEPVLATSGGASNTVDLDALVGAEPDLIFIECCGFNIEASKEQWHAQTELRAALREWVNARTEAATQDAGLRIPRIVLTDGDAFFNRPGPRLVESVEILAEALWFDGRGGRNQRDAKGESPPGPLDDSPHLGRYWIDAPGFERAAEPGFS